MGKCINDPDTLARIVDNVTHFYGCTVTEDAEQAGGDPVKLPGVYVNETACVKLADGGEGKIVKAFDIPYKLRKTGMDVLNKFLPP